MSNVAEYLKSNIRFALAIVANVLALIAAIWWMIASNWGNKGPVEIEPIVTTIGLTATLLGLNFVNDKLTKPHIKVRMSMAIANHPIHGFMRGISITIENHSMIKAFINSFQVQLPASKQVIQFLYEGFTDQQLGKVVLEPGQAYSFNIVKKNFGDAPSDANMYGDFVVTTDIGYKFHVPAKEFREHFRALMRDET